MNSTSPTQTEENGRGIDGRFRAGNKLAVGNGQSRRMVKLRAALLKAVTPDDIRAVVAALIRQAIDGDAASAKILLDRVFGRPTLEVRLQAQSHLSLEERRTLVLQELGVVIEATEPPQLGGGIGGGSSDPSLP